MTDLKNKKKGKNNMIADNEDKVDSLCYRLAKANIVGLCLLLFCFGPTGVPGPAWGDTEVQAPGMESVEISGQIRVRGDWRKPASISGVGDAEKEGLGQRTRLKLDVQINSSLNAVVEVQDVRTWGEASSVGKGTNNVDLRQGFIEVQGLLDGRLSIRAGRMAVPSLGDQRLVSSLDWSHGGRSWEAVHATLSSDPWNLQVFAADTKNSLRGKARGLDVLMFNGLYLTRKIGEDHQVDAYVFQRDLSQDEMDFTSGLRVKGKRGPVDGSLEGIYQTNDNAPATVKAWAWAVVLGYSPDMRLKPRIAVEHAVASGDPDTSDAEVRTFDPLLPFGHFYLGHIDLVSWKNIRATKVMLKIKPCSTVSLHLDVHSFSLVDVQDAWYGGGRKDSTGKASKEVGKEIDVYAKGKLWKGAKFWAGYSRFQPAGYVRATGNDSPMDWAFMQIGVGF